LRRQYADSEPVYVLLRDGTVAANTDAPLDESTRNSIEALLQGTLPSDHDASQMPTPLVVTAPIQVGRELRGIVVLPPPPGSSPLARTVQRMVSLPGTAILIVATLLVAPLVFGQARRRLRALERAAEQLGSGDLSARAPDTGEDEISHVAGAFNRMAAELNARDAALRQSDRLRRQMLADVSHELRTPLTSMIGFIDTLRMPEMALDHKTRERTWRPSSVRRGVSIDWSVTCSILRGWKTTAAPSNHASSRPSRCSDMWPTGTSTRRARVESPCAFASMTQPTRCSPTPIASSR
jgi:signal transduction histidine kinase